jgi:hypothetical protein
MMAHDGMPQVIGGTHQYHSLAIDHVFLALLGYNGEDCVCPFDPCRAWSYFLLYPMSSSLTIHPTDMFTKPTFSVAFVYVSACENCITNHILEISQEHFFQLGTHACTRRAASPLEENLIYGMTVLAKKHTQERFYIIDFSLYERRSLYPVRRNMWSTEHEQPRLLVATSDEVHQNLRRVMVQN